MKKYIFSLFFYSVFVIVYFTEQYSTRLDLYHANTVTFAKKTFEGTVNSFELFHDSFHAIYADQISNIMAQSNDASLEKRDALREQLNTLLIDFYNTTSFNALAGLTFVDKNGLVLLRMHQQNIHDDKIENIRPSFKSIAKDFLYKKGLELGDHNDGYRYQYPLFYDGEYVGAYEYSVSFSYILREMKKTYTNNYMLLLYESMPKYKELNLGSKKLYYNHSFSADSFNTKRFEYIQRKHIIQEYLKEKKDEIIIDYRFEKKCYSLVLCSIKDINNKELGIMLVDISQSPKTQYEKDFFIEIFLSLFLGLFIFIFMFKIKQHNHYVHELLNVQSQMLIVTNGTILIDANETFFKFFGYKDIKEFSAQHDCVCDFFIEDEGYLGKYKDGLLWTEYIQKHPKEKYKVKIEKKGLLYKRVFELEWVLFEKTSNLFISFRDITDELHEKQELENRANYDALTKIYNRGRFEYFLNKHILKSMQEKSSFSLIMFDIDHFKSINDTLGHDIGDRVLEELARLISSHIREGDIFARWGGEEFMVIVPLQLRDAHTFAEKLRHVIEEHYFEGLGELRCSFGVAQVQENDTINALSKRADEMLYKAKHHGRNCVIST